jgi:hypothetical protein
LYHLWLRKPSHSLIFFFLQHEKLPWGLSIPLEKKLCYVLNGFFFKFLYLKHLHKGLVTVAGSDILALVILHLSPERAEKNIIFSTF